MALPILVGVTGFKRAGKDTLAQVLIDEAGYERVAFADALKAEVADYLGITVSQLEEEKARWREILQFRGCAVRAHNQNHWISIIASDLIKQGLGSAAVTGKRFVVTDVRFRNEAAWIHAWRGTIIRVVRDGVVAADPSWHISEREVSLIKADECLDAATVEERIQGARDLLARWRADEIIHENTSPSMNS